MATITKFNGSKFLAPMSNAPVVKSGNKALTSGSAGALRHAPSDTRRSDLNVRQAVVSL